ncbi:unnamed protein product [Eruca vesicaria subsp. sativa]|uniref:Uncharacterized protein n=1 Tax=Eruca vesicaria subsp. sativa TaxID=29727 RepID=A0ABC8KAN7_ERUVS|nr:unnamed protein product [Eruca vesicaria subsp. sativa]
MYPEPEEQYREFPFGYPHEQTVGHKDGYGEAHTTMPCDISAFIRGELPRKRGHPSKMLSAAGEPLRAFTKKCQCKALFQNTQGDRSVVGNTKDFINQAKLCKPKTAEMWSRWYKKGFHGVIKAKLKGILEPIEFALVKRTAGFAIEVEEKIAAQLAAVSSSEKGNTEKDPRMDDDDLGASGGEPPKKKRGPPWKSSIASCDCDVLVQMLQKPRTAGLRVNIREELAGVMEPLKFSLVKRVAGQALDAKEWLVKRNVKAECDCSTEKDEDPEPAVGDASADGSGSETDRVPSPHCGWLSS